MWRKGQVEMISVVLISGIIISLVGFAYMFGMPLIEKRSTITQYGSAVKFMEDLDKKIVEMARSCTTQKGCDEKLTAPLSGQIRVDQKANSITYEFPVSQPLLTKDVIMLNTINPGEFTPYGETPGKLTMEGYSVPGAGYRLKFVLHYRELYNEEQKKSYKISLAPESPQAANGTSTINFYYAGTTRIQDAGYSQYDLLASNITMNIL